MTKNSSTEVFYRDLWRTKEWGSHAPNDDELSRSDEIVRLIENRFSSSTRQQRSLAILDLGCGRGWLSEVLSHFGHVLAIDPVEEAIKRAKELYPHIEFSVATGKDLIDKGLAQHFDLVVSSEVIEHVKDAMKEEFLKTIHSLLKPSGYLILTTPRGELQHYWKKLKLDGQPVENWISEQKLDELSLDAGFKVVDRSRAFIHSYKYNSLSHFVSSSPFAFLSRKFPKSRILNTWAYRCKVYQVVLYQRPS